MLKTLILICATTGCTKPKTLDEVKPEKQVSEIRAKADLYISLHKGWAHDRCDSLGFTALCKLSSGCTEANIFDAEDDGMWYRSPDHRCYDDGESKSDFSKDMMVMLLTYLVGSQDKDAVKRIRHYGDRHAWTFGRGPLSRTLMTPPIIKLIHKYADGKSADGDYLSEVTRSDFGFEQHLDAVWAILNALILDGMPSNLYENIENLSNEQPRNALLAAIKNRYKSGNQQQTIDILLDRRLFPDDRLPTSHERCTAYLWQRDQESDDWKPCEENKTHDGVDFLIAAWAAGQL